MTDGRMRLVVLAALVCGAAIVPLILGSDHQDATTRAVRGDERPAAAVRS